MNNEVPMGRAEEAADFVGARRKAKVLRVVSSSKGRRERHFEVNWPHE